MAITTIIGNSGTDLVTLLGSEYSDTLTIDSNSLYVNTLEGDDRITGSSSIERLSIESDTGNDTLIFTSEILKSTLSLGIGNDNLLINDFSGSVYGGAGDDSISATQDRTLLDALIRGNEGKDKLGLDNTRNSIINTNTGDDSLTITGILFDSQVYTGRQNDTILISGQAINSLIRGDANQDIINITGNLTGSSVNGNADDDQLIVSSPIVSSSTVYGGKGRDSIDISSDAIYVNGGKDGDDINIFSSQKHTIYGGAGDDTIDSDSSKSIFINGGNDRDIITVSSIAEESTAHTVNGGAAADSLTGSSGKEVLDGGTEDNGEDTLISGGGDDTIYGRAGNDLINLQAGVNAGNILVRAGGGDDVIEVTLDELRYQDTIKGDAGNDTLAIVGSPADFDMFVPNTQTQKAFNSISTIETLAFGTQDSSYIISGTKTINLSNKVQAAGIKTIDVSNATGFGRDTLEVNAFQFSSSTNLTFIGSDDKDVNVNFTGGSGDDTLTTGKISEDGADTLKGSIGKDTFIIVATDVAAQIEDLGSGGMDAIIVKDIAKGVTAKVIEDYHAPTETSNLKSTSDVVLNAESHVDINMHDASGPYGYTINGGAAGSNLGGSKYNDSITGNSSDDSLNGNAGDDTLVGGDGADVLNGDAGNDTITGGLKTDRIDLGTGANQVIFTSGLTIDTITNFTSDDVGGFDLSELETANALVASTTVDFVNGAGTSISAGGSVVVQDVGGATVIGATTTVLSYTVGAVADAAALETALEAGGGLITTGASGALAKDDAILFQYIDSDTSTSSFAIGNNVAAIANSTQVDDWEIKDIATTDLTSALAAANYTFLA